MTQWTVACHAPQYMEFSRQEYWSRLLFLIPGDLPDPGIKSVSLASPILTGRFFTIAPPEKATVMCNDCYYLRNMGSDGKNLENVIKSLNI